MPPTDRPDASSSSSIFPIVSRAGIKRDGTKFDGDNWTNGQHTRFQRGRPKKMGGYRDITQSFNGPIRQTLVHTLDGNSRIFCGSGTKLEFTDVTRDGFGSGVQDITPSLANGFIPSNNNTWQFAELYDSTATNSRLLAHAAPNLAAIDSTAERKIWFGDIDGTSALIDTTAPQVSGGICTAAPYAMAYGNDGLVEWCVPNLPGDWAGAGSGKARVTRSKIVWGSEVRGGAGQSPAFLLLSTDSVIQATFNGGSTVFDFDTISAQSSILSSAAVIEYDGIFYWPALDRFLAYNGVVQPLQNDMNSNWFFDHLNYRHAQKVWATKIPRYGEIWWFYPRDGAEECNAAIIYNVNTQIWYDTAMERSAGYYPQVFRWPVMAAVQPSTTELIRPTGGTPATSALGTAANAFDDNVVTTCTQTSADGNISYDFGLDVTKQIVSFGIISKTTQTYALEFEYSDPNAAVWTSAVAVPSQSYVAGQRYDFPLQLPIAARAWRVRETGGGTLDIAEFYLMSYGYVLNQHEFGMDAIQGNTVTSIRAFIETADISYMAEGPLGDRWLGVDRWLELNRIEPDVLQVGDMVVTIIGRRTAQDVDSEVDKPMPAGELQMDMTEQARQMRLRFASDVQNGSFEFGQIVVQVTPGDPGAT